MVALVGPYFRVGRVRGNKKYFIFGPNRLKKTSCDCLVRIALSKSDVTTNFQEKHQIFDRYFFLKEGVYQY